MFSPYPSRCVSIKSYTLQVQYKYSITIVVYTLTSRVGMLHMWAISMEQKKRLSGRDNPDAAASEENLGAGASVTAKASRNARWHLCRSQVALDQAAGCGLQTQDLASFGIVTSWRPLTILGCCCPGIVRQIYLYWGGQQLYLGS